MSNNKRPRSNPNGNVPVLNHTQVVSAPAILAAVARSPVGSAIQRTSSSTGGALSSPVMPSDFSSAFLALSAEAPTTPSGDDQDAALYNEIAALAHPSVILYNNVYNVLA